MMKNTVGFLFVGLLLCSLFMVSGCASMSGIVAAPLTPDFQEKYQELKAQGERYIKEEPKFEETRRVIVSVYKMNFIKEYLLDCDTMSFGLQSIAIQQTRHQLGESLLAVSAYGVKEFSRMLPWYQDNVETAEEFLAIARKDPDFRQIVEEGNLKRLGDLLEKNGFIVCDLGMTMDALKEYKDYLLF